MTLAILSFLAGILTVLAPCVLPVLPVIISGSIQDRSMLRPFIITASLGISILFFTLILKATTLFIQIPESFWQSISGGIILFFGITLLFPEWWECISLKLGLGKSQNFLQKSSQKQGIAGMILLGIALGPVFATCSPTYAIILATVLPVSFFAGIFYLVLYSLGLALALFFIAIFGQKIVAKFKWAANPHGIFKHILGTILVFVGILIMTGLDKDIETWILDQGTFSTATSVEQNLLERFFPR